MASRTFVGTPALSFNLYCTGRLDEVISLFLAPFSANLQARFGDSIQGLWFQRYSCRGEHLKIRIHADLPAKALDELRAEAKARALAFLSTQEPLPRSQDQPAALSKRRLIPVDLEDRGDGDHPDHSFLVTHFERSEVHFGPLPWPQDDSHVSCVSAALSASAELYYELASKSEVPLPHRLRQSTLWRLVIAALGSFAGDPERLREYLSYHQHWLVQYIAGGSAARAKVWLDKLEKSRIKAGRSLVPLERAVAVAWFGEAPKEPARTRWTDAVDALITHAETRHGDEAFLADPFTTDVAFAPLFKVLHGAANQLGLHQRDEALAYTILLSCLEQTQTPQEPGSALTAAC